MKKYLAFGCILVALFLTSCKSTDTEEAPTETSVTENAKVADEANEAESIEVLVTKAEEARAKAVEAGAQDVYPDDLAKLDVELEALKAKVSEPTDGLAGEVKDLTAKYQSLEKASKAAMFQKRVDELSLLDSDSAEYKAAAAALKDYNDALASGTTDGKTLLAKATVAYDAYYVICYESFKKLADEERKNALAEKRQADSVKAGVAKKEEYKAATETFQNGDNCYVTKDPEGAYTSYQKAKIAYTELYTEVSEKRVAAQKAIEEAKKKVQEASEFAVSTDETNPLEGDKVEGIEEEDAVLLEEDTFANPDEAVIEVEDENALKEKAGE